MSNGYEAKILTPYIHALKDVVLRLYLIETAIEILQTEKDDSPAMSFILAAFN